ncbi:uncharacterized protein BX664DRAFT_330322 [Halteromyces radiatus]|uniref:uncharacterized protein n=1 Tax=Halteromyces radiatus TaxID=101107 RepID=UPI00221FDE02|nr:uncharacterized protein BX664DRAFT_330322 [Halteromyces radiatus]KAI8093686.1 hypothetical protein BX664DRAFT_330322 [Halteromyces radiatus]
MTKEPLIRRIPNASNKTNIREPSSSDAFIEQKATGLFEQAKLREQQLKQQSVSTAQYIWQAIFLSIPFGLLLAAFDVTVKVQFDEPWDYYGLGLRAIKAAPALCPVIYLTNRHKAKKWTQVLMTLGSITVGAFLLYTLQHSPSLGQMLRAPGLATIWVYFIVQLDLIPAVFSLAIVAAYWHFGLHRK